MTAYYNEHDPKAAAYADRVVFLGDGLVIGHSSLGDMTAATRAGSDPVEGDGEDTPSHDSEGVAVPGTEEVVRRVRLVMDTMEELQL